MEYASIAISHDKNENNVKSKEPGPIQPEVDAKNDLKKHPVLPIYSKGRKNQGVAEADTDSTGDVNMEASILSDDVIRAGGFGARDDISSFLPVASDSTDFEASLRDAREYEGPQDEICRPGLGWVEATKLERYFTISGAGWRAILARVIIPNCPNPPRTP